MNYIAGQHSVQYIYTKRAIMWQQLRPCVNIQCKNLIWYSLHALAILLSLQTLLLKYNCSLLTDVLTSLDDINTGCISTQVVGSDTDVDSKLVHSCDVEGEIATCRVRVQMSGFFSHQYPGEADGRVPSGCTYQVNRLSNHHWRHWLYSCPTGWI